MNGKVLVACVGNVLRGDDGFGVAVAQRLAMPRLPPMVELVETGTGGLGIVQELMSGYEALVVVDAVDRGAAPGSVFVLVPHVCDPAPLHYRDWNARFSNLHLAEPSRVLLLARALGVLPERVLVVGCQPEAWEGYGEELSPSVRAAVEVAATRVRELADELVGCSPSADVGAASTFIPPSPPPTRPCAGGGRHTG